ncbi:unannotated protein [freshwater metagenome]|uniref:Unannotated protein n=1 Tax=freshwater metagenome TaxID=449393 RepID=A0A6J7LY58_9ZZZZ
MQVHCPLQVHCPSLPTGPCEKVSRNCGSRASENPWGRAFGVLRRRHPPDRHALPRTGSPSGGHQGCSSPGPRIAQPGRVRQREVLRGPREPRRRSDGDRKHQCEDRPEQGCQARPGTGGEQPRPIPVHDGIDRSDAADPARRGSVRLPRSGVSHGATFTVAAVNTAQMADDGPSTCPVGGGARGSRACGQGPERVHD